MFNLFKLTKSETPILYSFRRCPYAIRAKICVLYSGFRCYIREIDIQNKPEEFLKISTKGTVPLLKLTDGSLLEESLDIMNFCLEYSDPENINSLNNKQKELASIIISRNDEEFTPLLHKYKYSSRYPASHKLITRKKIEESFLKDYNSTLQLQPFMMGNNYTIVDFAILPFLRQFSLVDPDWFCNSQYTNIKEWLEFFTSSTLFSRAMVKYPIWTQGEKDIIFE